MKFLLLVFFFTICYVFLIQPVVQGVESGAEKQYAEQSSAVNEPVSNRKSAFSKYKSTDGLGEYIAYEELES